MIPEIFTEQERQTAILRAIIDNNLFSSGFPALICNLNPDSISAALRLHTKVGLPWEAFLGGFHFMITPTEAQLSILKSYIKEGDYFYGSPYGNVTTFIMVDAISRVPFEVKQPDNA